MRHFPVLENGKSPDELLIAMAKGDDVRELANIGINRWREMKSGARPVSMREFELLRFLCGFAAPASWGEWSDVKITQERLYLAGMHPKDGITREELKMVQMTRADLRMVWGQSELIERLKVERDFYKKQCGFEAKHGLMLWRCFGD
ncbi:hypothetical protein [Chitinilyticum litopenaei]|uniref:hypothetical protein n=1 Tax=Chitinilyticum litopenaei TaxID=1121276 RepID=UPI00049007E3|nr:hypothetical protein [Chitinilyticum litopenaei]